MLAWCTGLLDGLVILALPVFALDENKMVQLEASN